MTTYKQSPIVFLLVLVIAALATLPANAQAPYNEAVFESIRTSDFNTLNALLIGGEDVNQQDRSKNTPLMVAAKIGDRLVVGALLSNEADPNIRNGAGATALMLAAKYGHMHVVEHLLLYGADPLIKNNSGIRASRFAAVYKHSDVYQVLIDAENEALKGLKEKPKTTS